jgi:FkbM family methyltransferase
MSRKPARALPVGSRHVQGGNVPGGHRVIWDGRREPFITPTREFNSVPLRHSDVVVDIGAYVGTYAIRCARFPVRRVVAYEPTPRTFAILALTRLPNLECVPAAVVPDERPAVDLFVSRGIGVTNSLVLSRRKAGAITVPAVAYARAVAGATVVKIDVEGAEYTYPIVQPSLRAIIIDFHPIPGRDWVGRARQVMDGFGAAGFTPVVVPDFSNGWTRAASFVRDRPDPGGGYEPMLAGRACCGCGGPIRAAGRGLCRTCWAAWLPRHREGYRLTED